MRESIDSEDTLMAIDPGRVKALFLAAIERDDPVERRAFLDAKSATTSRVARPAGRPARRLRPSCRPHSTVPSTRPDSDVVHATDFQPRHTGRCQATREPEAILDTVIAGRYKIRQEIGEGGMGTVYLAEQTAAGPAPGRPEADQAGHGLAERPGPVRVGAPGPGPDGPPEHRQGPRRRHHRRRAGRSSSWSWSRASR